MIKVYKLLKQNSEQIKVTTYAEEEEDLQKKANDFHTESNHDAQQHGAGIKYCLIQVMHSTPSTINPLE